MSAIFDWATPENLQPEPITLDIWRKLPEAYCRQVEVVNGQAVRCEAPSRPHQKAARRLADMIESAAELHMTRNRVLEPDAAQYIDVPIRIKLDWARLAELTR